MSRTYQGWMAALLLAVPAAAATAQSDDVQTYLSVLGTYTVIDDDRTPLEQGDYAVGGRLILGRQYASRLGWGVALESQVIDTDIGGFTDFYRHSFELHGTYALGDRVGFTPYVLAGVGGNYNDVRAFEEDDSFDVYGTAGLGFVTPALFESLNLKLRFELRYIHDRFNDGLNDYQAGLGFEVPIDRREAPMPEPVEPEVQVVEVDKELVDSDGDGIVDNVDECPNTPAGTRVDAVGCPLADVLRLHGVLFAFDSAQLEANARRLLDPVVEIFSRYPDLEVEVAGHTDSVGPDAYNQGLSQRRAEAVRDYLIAHGVPESQVSAAGYGESEPIDSNDTEEGRQQNRRVEIRILN